MRHSFTASGSERRGKGDYSTPNSGAIDEDY